MSKPMQFSEEATREAARLLHYAASIDTEPMAADAHYRELARERRRDAFAEAHAYAALAAVLPSIFPVNQP